MSICGRDADGPLCSHVQHGVTGARYTAIRGEGAWLDDTPVTVASTTDLARSVVAISGLPPRVVGWRQFRALGSAALALCDVAAGHVDGYLDGHANQHAPWDYLGALLVCREAGATVVDAEGRDLEVADPTVRRQLLAAGTSELVAALREAVA